MPSVASCGSQMPDRSIGPMVPSPLPGGLAQTAGHCQVRFRPSGDSYYSGATPYGWYHLLERQNLKTSTAFPTHPRVGPSLQVHQQGIFPDSSDGSPGPVSPIPRAMCRK